MGVKVEARKNFASVDVFLQGLGSSAQIQRAAADGLNEHLRMQERNAVRFIGVFTNLGQGRVQQVTKSVLASPGPVMVGKIETRDKAIPAGELTGRTWSRSAAGATHKDWRGQTLKGSFTVRRWGGAIFARTSEKRFPLKKLWGPVLPSELARETRPNVGRMRAFAQQDLLPRVMRKVSAAIMR